MESRGHILLCYLHSLLNELNIKFALEVCENKVEIFSPSKFTDPLQSVYSCPLPSKGFVNPGLKAAGVYVPIYAASSQPTGILRSFYYKNLLFREITTLYSRNVTKHVYFLWGISMVRFSKCDAVLDILPFQLRNVLRDSKTKHMRLSNQLFAKQYNLTL